MSTETITAERAAANRRANLRAAQRLAREDAMPKLTPCPCGVARTHERQDACGICGWSFERRDWPHWSRRYRAHLLDADTCPTATEARCRALAAEAHIRQATTGPSMRDLRLVPHLHELAALWHAYADVLAREERA